MDKKVSRIRRGLKTRSRIKQLQVPRLSVHRTPRHIYAQIITPDAKVLASASTVQADIKKGLKSTGNVSAATLVGKLIAERAKQAGIEKVAFDRSGFKYHGRIKALADAARENGLQF
jgi:large subunit ribosomal protein L18